MYEYVNTQRCEKVFQRYDLNMQHSFDEDAEAVPISTIWIESHQSRCKPRTAWPCNHKIKNKEKRRQPCL
jgi:hypothetical protein